MLVGAAASGKTTVRRRLLAAGLEDDRVVSLDDLRLLLRARATEPKPLQDYTLGALRLAARQQTVLCSTGRGYVSDATNLRRRERTTHRVAAETAGLPAYAVLLPAVPLEELVRRNAARPALTRVPEEVLAQHAARRGLLSPEVLLDEGFADVVLVVP